MNKWQIICPVAAVVIVAVVFAVVTTFVSGPEHHRYYVYAQTRMIGEDLVETTNSTRLVQIGSGLRERLSDFLAYPAGVAEVLQGDTQSPIGDGTACSRLVVSNVAGQRLCIRLRQDSKPEKFHVLGFWTITEDGATTGNPLIRSETNRSSSAVGSRR